MSIIDKEIKDLKEKLTPHKTTSECISLSTSLRNHLEKEEKDQSNKKQKKYNRGTVDYKTNLVFNWQKKISSSLPSENDVSEMEVTNPVIQNPDRRLVYKPNVKVDPMKPRNTPQGPKGGINRSYDSGNRPHYPQNPHPVHPSTVRGRGAKNSGRGSHHG